MPDLRARLAVTGCPTFKLVYSFYAQSQGGFQVKDEHIGREGECFDFLTAEELDTRPTLTFPLGEQSTLLPVRQ